jgi:hypothetical protein
MFNHLRQYPVVLLSIIADASYAQRSQLPGVLIINLCYRHIVTTTDAADDGLQYLPLAFEGLVLRQAKPQLAYTKVHMMVIPDAEAIVHWQTFGVQLLPTDAIQSLIRGLLHTSFLILFHVIPVLPSIIPALPYVIPAYEPSVGEALVASRRRKSRGGNTMECDVLSGQTKS